ncbi:DUF262 domain-containing protein [Mycobacterium sp. GA-1841]|uniref:DUF262 domain-containing protein n=1 Tax=Mycobacterium sp. GA-1841 TaxID=1834154 RepID=UPI001C3773C0|nr:DUF262 domain-containing protein [Mycobacterium sp. GA-1841]
MATAHQGLGSANRFIVSYGVSWIHVSKINITTGNAEVIASVSIGEARCHELKLDRSDLQLETIVSRIINGELDLQPDFQRGEIWDLKRKQRLVDTILREWYVPAVHIVRDTAGNELVLDGQQRLVAVRDFFSDLIKIDGHTEPHDESIAALHNMTYSDLPESVRRAVNRFPLQSVTLRDHTPAEPNELFFRLNQGSTLTPAEKRNALHGRARDQVKTLVNDLTQMGLLSREAIGLGNMRLAYDDIIARACVAIDVNDMRKHINNTVVEQRYRQQEPFQDHTLEIVRSAGRALLDLINECEYPVRFNKGTLQTWLVYCCWAPIVTDLPKGLLQLFESQRRHSQGRASDLDDSEFDPAMVWLIKAYEDRASYRVTDVSSVLIRDFAIHFFSFVNLRTPDRRDSAAFLRHLVSSQRSISPIDLSEVVQEIGWGAPIIEPVSS